MAVTDRDVQEYLRDLRRRRGLMRVRRFLNRIGIRNLLAKAVAWVDVHQHHGSISLYWLDRDALRYMRDKKLAKVPFDEAWPKIRSALCGDAYGEALKDGRLADAD